jgi:hypothetical protein
VQAEVFVSKHTPGPWKLVAAKEGWKIKAPAGCVLAGVSKFPPPAELAPQCEANARLMVASPKLLKALEDLLANHVQLVSCGDCGNWDVEKEPAVIAARAAIAKATGAA